MTGMSMMNRFAAEATKDKSDKKTSTSSTTATRDIPLAQPDIFNVDDKPIAVQPSKSKDKKSTDKQTDLRVGSQSDTLAATSGIAPSDRMRDLLSRMRDIEGDTEDAGYPEPEKSSKDVVQVTKQTLPAVAKKSLSKAGVVTPTFHKVSNLPGNMSRAIRQMGKQLFRVFTTTPTDDIHMIGNVMGMGPNSQKEVNAVAGYLRDKGIDIGTGDIDFNDIIPGYRADTYQYSIDGIRWLLVRDEFGQYIYTWPENTSVQHSDTKKLGKSP